LRPGSGSARRRSPNRCRRTRPRTAFSRRAPKARRRPTPRSRRRPSARASCRISVLGGPRLGRPRLRRLRPRRRRTPVSHLCNCRAAKRQHLGQRDRERASAVGRRCRRLVRSRQARARSPPRPALRRPILPPRRLLRRRTNPVSPWLLNRTSRRLLQRLRLRRGPCFGLGCWAQSRSLPVSRSCCGAAAREKPLPASRPTISNRRHLRRLRPHRGPLRRLALLARSRLCAGLRPSRGRRRRCSRHLPCRRRLRPRLGSSARDYGPGWT